MGINKAFKSNRGFIIAGALTAVMALGTTAAAQGFGRGGFPMMRVLRHLDLSESQEIQAVKMRRAMREQRKAARDAMDSSMQQVKAELQKENPDPQTLHAAVDAAADQMRQGLHTAVDQFLELHKTFTPEQRAKLGDVMDKMKRRHQRRHRRGE
ncbi:MAG: periplasmic heavy metal sensor [Myxococcota bacterium]